MSGDSLTSMFYWTIYKRGDTEGNTLMGRSHTILQQYGLTLTKTVIYEQYSYTGKMVSWILYVPFLMTIHSTKTLCPNAATILILF